MPQITAEVFVPVAPDIAFAVSQTTGRTRLSWDPFLRRQRLLDGAERAAKDVRTFTQSRHGLKMRSRYVSFNPPTNVGITMEKGPWFFETFGAGWRFKPEYGGTRAVWKYSFTVKPSWLRFAGDAIGRRVLGSDIQRRIRAFAAACENPDVLAALHETQ